MESYFAVFLKKLKNVLTVTQSHDKITFVVKERQKQLKKNLKKIKKVVDKRKEMW